MTDRYAVVGNPVEHSKSPRIHQLFAAATGQDLAYDRMLAPPDGFAALVRDFFAQGGKGLNVTVPFKEEAWALAALRSPRAQKAGAANTLLLREDGQLYADNTDGAGLLRDLQQNHGVALADQRVLVLGAGGAVRGVLGPLLAAQPAHVVIANRTLARAEELARLFAGDGPVTATGYAELAGQSFDLLINGTSASLSGAMPDLPSGIVAPGATAYDMVYGSTTPFLRWATAQGAGRVCDGIGMLVEQAAEAFCLWRGIRPDTSAVLATLRAEARDAH